MLSQADPVFRLEKQMTKVVLFSAPRREIGWQAYTSTFGTLTPVFSLMALIQASMWLSFLSSLVTMSLIFSGKRRLGLEARFGLEMMRFPLSPL